MNSSPNAAGEGSTMRAPWLAERVISLRSCRRCNASRSGPRLTPYWRANAGSLIFEPGASSPARIAASDGYTLLREGAAALVIFLPVPYLSTTGIRSHHVW